MILLIVFIHQLLCIENTKEQSPDMHFCYPLQENISSFRGGLPPPTPPAYRFFFSGYASECLSLYDIFEMSTVVLLIFEACITHLIHVKLIKFDILVYTCIAYGNVKHKKLFHRITNNK
jgi:hypothetical protein